MLTWRVQPGVVTEYVTKHDCHTAERHSVVINVPQKSHRRLTLDPNVTLDWTAVRSYQFEFCHRRRRTDLCVLDLL